MLREVFAIVFAHEGRYPDLRWINHSAGESMDVVRRKLMAVKGVRAGILDIEWPLAAVQYDPLGEGTSYYAHGLGIELKAGKNQLTEDQRDRIAWLQDQAWVVRVCRSGREAWRAIITYAELDCACSECQAARGGGK